jgi:UMF1 family MFS transporter
MYFLEDGRYLLGGGLFPIASVSFGAAFEIYNSFLPKIARPEERDAVSSKGWAAGYLGARLLLALNLLLYGNAARMGRHRLAPNLKFSCSAAISLSS